MDTQLQIINETIAAGTILRRGGLISDFLASYRQSGGELRVRINTRGDFAWFNRGFYFHKNMADGDPIRLIELRNDNADPVDVQVIIGVGDWIDPRPVIPAGFAELPHVALASGTDTQILPEDSQRMVGVISNLDSNTEPVYLGGAGLGAGEGMELVPGSSVQLPTTAPVYGFQASGGPVSVGVAVLSL